MIVFDIVSAIAGVATAVGVGFAAVQLRESKRENQAAQARERATFELRFSDRYDQCIRRIPLSLLLDETGYEQSNTRARRAFYDYFELCEQECFYRDKGQIGDATWKDWCEGIKANQSKTSFQDAWNDLSEKAGEQFETFRRYFPSWDEACQLGSGV